MEYGPVIEFIRGHEKFILTVHETPDGDAIGSQYAMFRALKKLGKTVKCFNADPAPWKFNFVDAEGEIRVLEGQERLPADLDEYVLIILDVNDTHNIGQVATLVLPKVREYFIIDHHDSEQDTTTGNLIEQSASSTCEILFQLFTEMKIPIDFPMARALFMGILFDTGSFIYPKTTALTFEIAHRLVSMGVSPNQIYANVFESNSIPSLVMMSKVMGTLELHFGNHVAIQTLTPETILASQGKYEEADQFINLPLRSADIRVSIFFKENLEGIRRCSMRSKGNIDVAAIAQGYGGGGHKTAAGFKCAQPFAAVQRELLEKLSVYFPGDKP